MGKRNRNRNKNNGGFGMSPQEKERIIRENSVNESDFFKADRKLKADFYSEDDDDIKSILSLVDMDDDDESIEDIINSLNMNDDIIEEKEEVKEIRTNNRREREPNYRDDNFIVCE